MANSTLDTADPAFDEIHPFFRLAKRCLHDCHLYRTASKIHIAIVYRPWLFGHEKCFLRESIGSFVNRHLRLPALAQRGTCVDVRHAHAARVGDRETNDTELLRTFIKKLRSKLRDDAARPTCILTERGVGYRMAGPSSL